eukprot:TRINITY_DN5421_c0_g1_i1.p1 TRINITY_DN5421_c0_g1~~TRINITY_DN5421_c0_g1_i1.p1  ORF type:complete len:656 (+),score=79.02 TRINITY_DN5421_c0_g1_i1:3537-5504(+)
MQCILINYCGFLKRILLHQNKMESKEIALESYSSLKAAGEKMKDLSYNTRKVVEEMESTLLNRTLKGYQVLEDEVAKLTVWYKDRKTSTINKIKNGFDPILRSLESMEDLCEFCNGLKDLEENLRKEEYEGVVKGVEAVKGRLHLKTVEIHMLRQKSLILDGNIGSCSMEGNLLAESLERLRIEADSGIDVKMQKKARTLMETTNAVNEQLQALKRQLLHTFELKQECEELSRQKASVQEKLTQALDKLASIEGSCNEMCVRYNGYKEKTQALEQLIRDRKDDLEALEKIKHAKLQILGIAESPVPAENGVEQRLLEIATQNFLTSSRCLHFYDPLTSTLQLHHIELHKTFSITPDEFPFPAGHDTAQIADCVYMNGGVDIASGKCISDTYMFELVENERISIKKLAESNVPKVNHKMLAFDSAIIYSIGGKGKSGEYLNLCERYNIKKNTWEKIPSLNEKKAFVGATVLDYSSIYVFGGYNSSTLGTIEVIRPGVDDKWSLVKLCSGHQWTPRQQVGCFQIGDEEILVFGGVDNSKAVVEEVFVFNIKNNTINKEAETLEKKEVFWTRTPIKQAGKVYIVGVIEKKIHVLDIDKKKWGIFPLNEQMNEENSINSIKCYVYLTQLTISFKMLPVNKVNMKTTCVMGYAIVLSTSL